jgi:hypothetical protein
MANLLRQFRDFFVSLRLTVVLLVLSIILVFAATLDQVHLGVWGVQEKYFHALFVMVRLGEVPVPVFPGGYLIGGFLLVNLLVAHLCRLRLTWRKLGIWLAHSGLILLLVGELISGLVQQDYQMRLDTGETKNFAESDRFNELAVTDVTDPAFDEVVAIPERRLAEGAPLQHPKLPFRVVPRTYYPNAALDRREQVPNAPPSPATQGIGPQVAALPLAVTYKPDEHNEPAAFIELVGPDGSLGTWLVSPLLGMPQKFTYAGRTWKLAMRATRRYQPFSLTLLKFTHEVYAGTDIPKNFSSRVRIAGAGGAGGREALIYMNNPLRTGGLTFYQASFDNDDRTTVLQVVRNPGWLIPYLACAAITLGLIVQFLFHLAAFARKRRGGPAAPAPIPAPAPAPAPARIPAR